jgi:hypothetical protein
VGLLGRFSQFAHCVLPGPRQQRCAENRLAIYTLRGYSVKVMKPKTQTACRSRLRRIEGQVRGIERMIDEERYCIDILTSCRPCAPPSRRWRTRC